MFDINNDGGKNLAEIKKIDNDLFQLIDEKDVENASKEILVQSAFSEMDEESQNTGKHNEQ